MQVGHRTGYLSSRMQLHPFNSRVESRMHCNRYEATTHPVRLHARPGLVIYELIVVLPLLIVPLIAVVVYGVLISNRQPLEMATRDGSLVASQLDLPLSPTNVVPVEVKDAIDAALNEVDIDVSTALANGTMHIRLEHNRAAGSGGYLDPPVVLQEGTLVCPEPNLPSAPDPAGSGREYVRLTVCVRSDLLTPNLLRTFEIDMGDRVTAQTKTYRCSSF